MSLSNPLNGGYLRSSSFLLLIIANLLFSVIFILSLGVHIVKPDGNNELQAEQKKGPEIKTQNIVTLANIQ
ncbi:MAG: hypothetical protein K2Q24_07615 [Chitinophagaceae bacterium]|jgi:hypothetical protein|nr:hypothetical protein [Chitinophagaceae bacterium]